MPTISTTTDTARPAKRGRPSQRLLLPSERPKVLALPFHKTGAEPTPEHQAAFLRLLRWLATAETASRPEDKLDALQNGLAALHGAGVSAGDLVEAAR